MAKIELKNVKIKRVLDTEKKMIWQEIYWQPKSKFGSSVCLCVDYAFVDPDCLFGLSAVDNLRPVQSLCHWRLSRL